MCCRCTAATTTPAGPAPTGGCAAAASCCSKAIRRPGCGCRWTRSAGSPPRPTYEADPLAAPRSSLPVDPEPGDARSSTTTSTRRPRRWSPRPATGCSTSSCRPPTSSSTSSTWSRRVEAAAAKADCPVVIEGYGPPPDPRLQSMSVTPDPGVIEVNVAADGQLRRAARAAGRRCTSRRGWPGCRPSRSTSTARHGGTGGGNHITLGGITPADSPLLRRPDLLVSLLTYWQRHPSLSYLFAGRFVGPTTQAPRVDEGRAEALYELEIAFAEIARLADRREGGAAKPWVADRALRHLLTDITGNTHRAEFCIDKLYSPDSARGRLGLLELRGFEMPPHFQMAMVQSLLVRSLVAWFWDEPLRAPLIRHGANLHGRYLLPHFLIHDIADVAADLRAHDINFDTSWLDPFTEFRFPRIGTARVRRRRDRAARRDRAVERPRRGVHRRRHRPLRRLLGRTHPGPAHRRRPAPLPRHRQRLSGAAAGHRQPRRPGRRRALPGLAAAQRAAPHHHGRRAAALRTRRHRRRGMSRGGCTYHVSTPAAAPTRRRRSTPWRPSRAGAAASRRPVSRRARSTWPTSARSRRACQPTSARLASSICVECVPFCSNGSSRTRYTRHRPPARRYRAARAQESLFDVRGGAGTGYDEFLDAEAMSGLPGRSSPNASANVASADWTSCVDGSESGRQRRHHLHPGRRGTATRLQTATGPGSPVRGISMRCRC